MFGKSIISFILRKNKKMEDNENKDNRNKNNIDQNIRSLIESTNKQLQIVSSTIDASTFAHRLHEGNYNRNKNKKQFKKGNNNRYNYYNNNNHSQHNPSLQKQEEYHQNNKKRLLYQDSLQQEVEFTFRPDVPCNLIDFVGGVDYTPSSDNGVIFNRVVKFFRDLTANIEQEKKILDFKFYLQEDQDQRFYNQKQTEFQDYHTQQQQGKKFLFIITYG
ncbi:hypothetical protein GLOIN_2v1585659 [Rhizophagus clarus]|uniref:Uncharacterized protein n=1 Tax=Rhizophagus clarus TaxID=94130 RepID=A0A8H3QEJ0_9GLOM|nr:hypothetical protein GLOIN_2v1585659 [Rhizophagus clarus]